MFSKGVESVQTQNGLRSGAERRVEARAESLIEPNPAAKVRLWSDVFLFKTHDGSSARGLCGKGCATTTRRCARPPGADSSW